MRRVAAVLGLAVLLGGCTLIPDFLRPSPPVPLGWPEGPAYRQPAVTAPLPAGATTADQVGWRDFFTDAQLQEVIALALANNRDLRTAVLNIATAESQFRAQRGELLPQIGLAASEQASRTPEGASGFTFTIPGTTGGGGATTRRIWNVNVGFSAWEIDLFGRVRSLTAQGFELFLGYVETRRSSQLSLVAQVAAAWLTIGADEELLALTRDTLENQEAGYRLTRASYDGGNATEVTLRQAQTSVETARANLALYVRQRAQDINALNLIAGNTVPEQLLPASTTSPLLPTDVPAGLTSDLLLRRPDVLAAERNLAAANANIGAARAAFFPNITLTASAGVAAGGVNRLFIPGSAAWTFAPQINLPILNYGINQANLDLSKAQRELQVVNYERTIQTAFREVADALAGRGTYDDQIAAQQRLVDAYDAAYQSSLLRFRAGLDNFQPALDSQRQLYAGQQDLIVLRLARLQNLITLYKVLGGGWEERTRLAGGSPGVVQ